MLFSGQPQVIKCWPALFKGHWLVFFTGNCPASQGGDSSLVFTGSLRPSQQSGLEYKCPSLHVQTPLAYKEHPIGIREPEVDTPPPRPLRQNGQALPLEGSPLIQMGHLGSLSTLTAPQRLSAKPGKWQTIPFGAK